MRPTVYLPTHASKFAFSNTGKCTSDRFDEIHLLLNASLDTTIGTILAQIADGVLEVFHQCVKMRVRASKRTQVTYYVCKNTGKSRTEYAGTAQVVAQAELLDKGGKQVEVSIRKLIIPRLLPLLQDTVHRLEETNQSSLTGDVLRFGLLERLSALTRAVDNLG